MTIAEAISVGVAAGLGWGALIGVLATLVLLHRLLGEGE